jgi:transcriptional regulator with XRE-family HTH domain
MIGGMTLRDLMRGLGGQSRVAAALGVTRAAVSHWVAADDIPEARRIDLWVLALDAGLDWTPPGAEALRDKLRGPARVDPPAEKAL